MNLFLSYSTEDSALVHQARRELEDAGHHAWMDQLRIPFGSSVTEGIERALEGADALLLFWSVSASTSPWVAMERDAWMSLLVEEQKRAAAEGRVPRRFLLPILLGDARPPLLLAPIRYLRLPADASESGWGESLRDAVAELEGGRSESTAATLAEVVAAAPALRLSAAAMTARRLLADLTPLELEHLAVRLDVASSARCAGGDAHCVEDLAALVARNGPSLIDLRESVLAVRSPFRLYDGRGLDDWRLRPPRNWHPLGDSIMTLGVAPRPFLSGPEDLREAALLQRNGIAFCNGCIRSVVYATLDAAGAVGLMLSCDTEGNGYAGIVRRTASDASPTLALLQLDHRAVVPLAESPPIPEAGFHPDQIEMELCRRGDRLELRAAGTEVKCDGAIRPAGEPGLVRFGPAAAHFYEITVDAR